MLAINILMFTILGFGGATSTVFNGDGRPGTKCMMAGDVVGTCEEVGTCLTTGGVVKRMGSVQLCQYHNGKVYVCCRRPNLVAQALCRSWRTFWRGSDNNQCTKSKPLIIGGEEAILGEFPHMTSVGFTSKSESRWICGGTLISPHFVLTAAHCVKRNLSEGYMYMVGLGEHDIWVPSNEQIVQVNGIFPEGLYNREQSVNPPLIKDMLVEQNVTVEKVLIYPDYVYKYHDIALLKLSKPVVLTRRALPACLPDNQDDIISNNLTVTGWGRISYSLLKTSRTLQKVQVPTVDRHSCLKSFKDNRLIPRGLTNDQFCAGEYGKDSCKGDSGGPIVDQLKYKGTRCEYSVVGVVSFGEGCGNVGVYTRVSSYLDWITGYIAPGLLGTDDVV